MKYKIVVFLLVIVLFVLGAGMTYSYFNSNATMNNINQRIARFIFEAQTLDNLEIPLIDMVPGQIEEYEFTISNTSDEKISDVSIEYQLTIETPHLIPLIIELYKDDVLILSCDETYSRNNNNELVCNTPLQELSNSDEELDEYRLVVTFDSQYNSESYSNLVDYINIEIRSYQKV